MIKFKLIESCVICGENLTYREVMYSHGVCPQCGADSYSTIVNTKRTVYKITYSGPWWNRTFKMEPKDE